MTTPWPNRNLPSPNRIRYSGVRPWLWDVSLVHGPGRVAPSTVGETRQGCRIARRADRLANQAHYLVRGGEKRRINHGLWEALALGRGASGDGIIRTASGAMRERLTEDAECWKFRVRILLERIMVRVSLDMGHGTWDYAVVDGRNRGSRAGEGDNAGHARGPTEQSTSARSNQRAQGKTPSQKVCSRCAWQR